MLLDPWTSPFKAGQIHYYMKRSHINNPILEDRFPPVTKSCIYSRWFTCSNEESVAPCRLSETGKCENSDITMHSLVWYIESYFLKTVSNSESFPIP